MYTRLLFSSLLTIILIFTGCGSDTTNTPNSPAPDRNITISPPLESNSSQENNITVTEDRNVTSITEHNRTVTTTIDRDNNITDNNIENNITSNNNSTPPSESNNSQDEHQNNTTPIDTDTNSTIITTSEISGRVIDGELIYATVFLDLNLNQLLDTNEPKAKTDENGDYSLLISSEAKNHANYLNKTAPLVSIGGFDKKSKKEFIGTFTAPFSENNPNITPITTLINSMLEADRTQTLDGVKSKLAKSLNIGAEDLMKDPVELAKSGDATLLELSLQIHQSSEVLSKCLVEDKESIEVYALMAKELNGEEVSLDVALENTVDKNSASFDTNLVATSKVAVKELNKNIRGIFENHKDDFGTDTTVITEIALTLDKTQNQIIDAVNRNEVSSIEEVNWEDNVVDDVSKEIVRQLLLIVGYTNEEDITDIAKFNNIDDDLTLETLKILLEADGNYAHIIDIIDEKLKDLKEEKGTNSEAIEVSDVVSNFTIKQVRKSDWNDGFCEDVEIKNISNSTLKWQVSVDVAGVINNLWSANYTQDSSTHKLTASGVSWNSLLTPNQTTSFGYCATKIAGTIDKDSSTDSSKLVITQSRDSDWNSGFCEKIKVKNNEDKKIIQWEISFDVEGKINNLWSANYTQDTNLRVIASGLSWNSDIPANGSIEFGYCATKVTEATNPDEIAVTEDVKALTFETIKLNNTIEDKIIGRLTLIKEGENGSTITWESDNSAINSSGIVIRPAIGENDVNVELLAVIEKGQYRKTKRFNLTVLALEKSDEDSVNEAKDALTFNTIRLLNLSEDKIYSNLNLITEGKENSSIKWVSNNSAIAIDGSVTRPAYGGSNISVTLTATLQKGDAELHKTFNLTVLSLEKNDADSVKEAKNALTFEMIRLENLQENRITSNLNLITKGVSDSSILWISSNTAVINSNGNITQPTTTEGNKIVTLKAIISKGDASDSKSFTLTVLAQIDEGKSDSESVLSAKNALTFDVIKNLNSLASEIKSSLNLVTTGSDGTSIAWSSDKSAVINNSGIVVRTESNESVVLTATITKGVEEATVTFALTVLAEEPVVEPPVTAESKYHDVLGLSLKFYEAQRAIGPFPTVTWRKPASTNDGSDVGVDLNGGWFDAGDHVKFSLPMAYSVGMLNWSMIASAEAYQQSGKVEYGKEQVKYALDYLLNSYQAGDVNSPDDDKVYFQVSDGNVDHSYWVAPEDINYERKTFTCDANGGCAAVSGAMVGAFASGAILFKESDPTYAQELEDNAKRLYDFAMKYPTDNDYPGAGQEGFYKLYSTNKDQLAWGAIWLYKLTNESSYLDKAKELMQSEYPWGMSWDNMNSGVLLLLAEVTNDADYKTRIENEVDRWLNDVPTTPAGFKVLLQWGSMRHSAGMSFISLLYSDMVTDPTKKQKFIDFGKSQIDYMLGDNPQNFSYVVGYGENYPKFPHHRGASGTTTVTDPNPNRYIIEGALVGGPKSASDTDYSDQRDSFIDNEVAVDYNAGFTGALAKLAIIYGTATTPKTDSEIVALDKEALTFDSIKNQNSAESQISTDLNLVTTGSYGSTISWSSSNSDIISSEGVVTAPTSTQGDQVVTLTATIIKGSELDTQIFTVTVLSQKSDSESVLSAKNALTFDVIKNLNSLASEIKSSLNLVTTGSDDTVISWNSDKPLIISSSGTVIQTESNESVVLTATITKGAEEATVLFNLTVLAEEPVVQPPVTAESKYHDVLGMSLKFYEAQRDKGPFPTVDWRKPASINDGSDVGVDLNGGWFDAGDHVKFNLPMSYSVSLLNWSMISTPEAYTQVGKLDYGKEQVKYALDYLLNAYQAGADLESPDDDKVYFQVADGYTDHDFWGPPEEINMARPTFTCDSNGGCAAVSGTMVASFASGAILFKDDVDYAQRLLDSAKRLYQFAMKYPTDLDYSSVGQDFYKLYDTSNKDQLAWGAMWLYRATNDVQYLNDAKSLVEGKYPWAQSWDNMFLGVFELLAEDTDDSSYKDRVKNELNTWINKEVPTTPGGLRVRLEWGSLRYATAVSFISLMYSDLLATETEKEPYISFAKSQIDYALGDNPQNFSYVVGYGTNYPTHPHHRGASGTTKDDPNPNKYVIEGALVGGPMSADDSNYQDIRDGEIAWKCNEVTTDYNAGFTGALAKLALLYGEPVTPKTDSEIVALDKEALTFDSIKNQNSAESQISTDLNLVTTGSYGSTISWSSSNSDVISSEGVVIQPTQAEGNQVVTLTATITKGESSDTLTFNVTVLPEQDDSQSVALALENLTFDTIKSQNTQEDNIQSNLTLPSIGSDGTTISWSSSNSGSISSSGVIARGSSDVTVVLTATVTKGAVTQTKTFTLLVIKEILSGGFCQVTYSPRDHWETGFVVDVSVVNQLGNLSSWEVSFTLPTGETITDMWNGDRSANEGYVQVVNQDYNGNINDGSNIEFGFVINHTGETASPTDIRLNGNLCDGQIGGVEKPQQPINLEAELVNNVAVNLTWEDTSDNEDSFIIYRKVIGGDWEFIGSVPADITSYSAIVVETDKSYSFKVDAKNIAGAVASDSIDVTPLRITVESGTDNRAVALVSNCLSCHVATNSNPSIPVIHGLGKAYLSKVLEGYSTSNHFGFAMPRVMEGYSSDEIELMSTYFSNQLWVGNEITSYDVDMISEGESLYQTNCIACHGTDGMQNDIMLSKQSEQYLIDSMTNYAKGLHGDADSGMASMFKDTIGEDATKIEALAKYLAVGLEVPTGTNETIRGFDAKYVSATNAIEASWDYVNEDTVRIDVMVNGQVVQSLTDITAMNSVTISNDGNSSFVIGESYTIAIKAIGVTTETLSVEKEVAVMSDESYGELHYNTNCKVCHGVNGTARADITAWNPNLGTFAQFTHDSNMSTSYYANCDDECLDLIGVYVTNVLEPRSQEDSNTTALDVESDIVRGYRFLNTVEYTNTLYSLFEIDKDAVRSELLALRSTDLPKDNIVEGYNTDRDMNRIDEDKLNALNSMAQRVEAYLQSLEGATGGSCLINGYDFCVADKNAFLTSFATKIFRRPLSSDEITKYSALSNVGQIVGDMLVSPKFLYRSERGEDLNNSGIYTLTEYEIATAIAYSMSGTTPDDELLALAEEGKLLDANTRVTQAVRLLSLQTGKDKLDDFIGRWLLEDDVYSLFDKNPDRFVGYTPEVRTAQSRQILEFFRMVLESPTHSAYKDLFINDSMMTNRTISDYYGAGMSSSDIFEQVPATENRYGILTLGAIASKYANSEESHPFKRGKFVLARLMCHPLGLPGNGGDVPAIQDHVGENKRDRYAQHVNDPSCATCHNLMDPIGYTWEKYDGSGRYRTEEWHSEEDGGPKPIDASVTLKGLLTFDEAESYPAEGIRDVSQLIGESDRGPECMALQYYRYISGDTGVEIENSLVVKKIVADFKEEQYDLESLFSNIVALKAFITRKGV